MTTRNDQDDMEMQHRVENRLSDAGAGAASFDQEDAQAYRVLFDLLNDKPASTLPADFTSKVVASIQARRDQQLDFKWNFLLPLSLLVIFGILYGVASYFNNPFSEALLQQCWRFKWYVVFGVICFWAIQYLDQQL